MHAATPKSRTAALPALLAGLQSGLLGALCMLAWLGVIAQWQQRNFWIPANLMASVFYGPTSIHSGFAGETISGLAVYVALYSLLGALLALALRDRLSRPRTFLVTMAFALGWYYLSFRLLWKSMMPLVALLHVERATVFGHMIYGAILGGYPSRLPKREEPAPEPGHDPEGAASAS
jgi:hypothetical protein